MDESERLRRRVAAFDVMLDNLPTELQRGDPDVVDRMVEEIDKLRPAPEADDG